MEQPMETRPGVPQNGGNGLVFDRPRLKLDPVHREGSGIPQNGGNGPPMVETRVLFIGRGVAYRKTEETDLLRSKRGSCSSGGCGIPQNRGNGLVLERYGRNRGPVHREGCGIPQNGTPRDSVHLHRRPPPASWAPIHPASTGSCSSSLHHALLHPLLFNHPSTIYCSSSPPPSTVHPALHTTGSCSTTPPRPLLDRLLFIQPSTPRVPVHPEATPPLTVHPNPPTTLTIHPRGSIDRLQLAAVAKESLHRVQLTAINRSLGFSNV